MQEVLRITIDDVDIRNAKSEDVQGIVEIWIESARYHGDLDPRLEMNVDARQPIVEFHEKQLIADNTLFLVAVVKKQIVGYILARVIQTPPFHPRPAIGFIDGIAVSSTFRRQGIGSQLYDAAIEWFKAQNINRIQTTVAEKNPQARFFWRRKGYSELVQRLNLDLKNC